MQEIRDLRNAIERWVDAQPKCPGRKQVVEAFPTAPHRLIRSAVQSREDRERTPKS